MLLSFLWFWTLKWCLEYLQSTIGEFASIADKEIVSRLFKRTMHRLLEVTQEAGKAENSRNSNSMRIDDLSNESSASLLRWFSSLCISAIWSHLLWFFSVSHIISSMYCSHLLHSPEEMFLNSNTMMVLIPSCNLQSTAVGLGSFTFAWFEH